MKFSINARHLMIACAALALAVGAPTVMFFKHKAQKAGELAQLRTQLAGLAVPSVDIAPLQRQVDTLQKELESFRSQTPFQPDISVLLAELATDLPTEASDDREIIMRPSVNGAVLSRNPVRLRMKGPCDSSMALLRRIEKYRFLTRLERVVFEKRDPELPQPPLVELEFTLFAQVSAEALTCQP